MVSEPITYKSLMTSSLRIYILDLFFRYKNGDALENDDKYNISTDGRWHYVEIRNVSIEDEGEYVARINGSSFESMAQLLVDMTKVSFRRLCIDPV